MAMLDFYMIFASMWENTLICQVFNLKKQIFMSVYLSIFYIVQQYLAISQLLYIKILSTKSNFRVVSKAFDHISKAFLSGWSCSVVMEMVYLLSREFRSMVWCSHTADVGVFLVFIQSLRQSASRFIDVLFPAALTCDIIHQFFLLSEGVLSRGCTCRDL